MRAAKASIVSAVISAPAFSALRKSSNWRATPAMRASKMSNAMPPGWRSTSAACFRIAERLVGEAAPLRVDLKAALHDRRPGDQDVVRRRDRAVPLIAGEMREPRAERLAPQHRVALVAGMAEVERVGHLGDVAPHQRRVAAVAVAGEHQRAAADGLARAVARHHLDAFDEPVLVGEQASRRRARPGSGSRALPPRCADGRSARRRCGSAARACDAPNGPDS